MKWITGNTEIGIETKFKDRLYSNLIYISDIPDFKKIEIKQDKIIVGSLVTLSKLEERLKELCSQYPEWKVRSFQAILDNLQWFAGHQIRNVATWAGNVATASPISDLNPIFSALVKTGLLITELQVEYIEERWICSL